MNDMQLQEYNGRVQFENDNSSPYSLYTEITQENDSNPIAKLQTDDTLKLAYFSTKNKQWIQNAIRYQVWEQSSENYMIDNQNSDELDLVMRSIYLQFSRNIPSKDHLLELNNKVVDYCVSNILSQVKQYLGYKKDIQNLPKPIQHGLQTSVKGSKTLENRIGF